MLETFSQFVGLDEFTVLQIVAVSGLSGFIVSQVVTGWMITVFCYVGLFGAALGSNLLFRKLQVLITYNKQIDGILFSTAGLMAASLLFVGAILLLSAFGNRVGTSAQEMRRRSEQAEAAANFINRI